MKLLVDRDVERVTPSAAVAAMRNAILAYGSSYLIAPPRLTAELGGDHLVITAGRLIGDGFGFRAYVVADERPEPEQVTLLWGEQGNLEAVVIGEELGARRTGALGAVAVDALAKATAASVALIGSGRQAWAQLWALTAVRDVKRVRVFSPSEHNRVALAERCAGELRIAATAVSTAREAVVGADIVIMATTSSHPVIEAQWVAEGAHVTTVGPKVVGSHECPLELLTRASVVSTDSPPQLQTYEGGAFTTELDISVTGLDEILLGKESGRCHEDDITVHVSAGLAGTEVVLARHLLAACD